MNKNKLSAYFETDRSNIIKKSLKELYENLIDLKIIEDFEKKEKQGNVKFLTSEEIYKELG